MKTELALARRLRRLTLAFGLSLAAATAAHGQDRPGAGYGPPPPADAPSADSPAADANQSDQANESDSAPDSRRRRGRGPGRARAEVHPYLEVAQVLSADLDGGETLTYTSVAVGIDGRIQTRRVTAQVSYRYERDIDWNGHNADQDSHAGLAAVSVQLVPGTLQLGAGAMATRTGGDGRVLGVTSRNANVDVYSAYVGPTLATHAGPLAINASYRLGYVKVDDHRANGTFNQDFDDSTAHSLTGSVGMAPGASGLPFGWTVGAGFAREQSGGRFDQVFQGYYVRGDVVLPIGPTLALTAGVGYEKIQADQANLVRDAGGWPVIGSNGPTPDPSAPRLLTYDLSGVIYDGGIMWRPSSRTELQARAGHRYGGTTFTGSFDHQFDSHQGVHAEVFDTVETFGHLLTNDLSGLPSNFNANRDPLTGGLGGCVFGQQGGSGTCFDRSLSAINGNSFRMRGASLVYSGQRGLWRYGLGASYAHRRYNRPSLLGVAAFAGSDETYSVYGSLGRQLSRTSEVNLSAYAGWYNSDVNADGISTLGATLSYSRSLFLEHLQFLAALGIYNSDDGTDSATNASASGALRYTF